MFKNIIWIRALIALAIMCLVLCPWLIVWEQLIHQQPIHFSLSNFNYRDLLVLLFSALSIPSIAHQIYLWRAEDDFAAITFKHGLKLTLIWVLVLGLLYLTAYLKFKSHLICFTIVITGITYSLLIMAYVVSRKLLYTRVKTTKTSIPQITKHANQNNDQAHS